MAERISATARIQIQNVAEREVMRYAGNHALWHKHVHDVELDPMQVLKMIEMDQHPNTVDYSCRRTGKTAVKELYLLEHNATRPDQEVGIVAPREAQAKVNLDYHLEAIRRSQILSAHINHKRGRTQIADTYYQFANRSIARSYGIMAQVDGGDMTAASLEEVDDMPRERLFSRFLLMMGAKRRLGASKESQNQPQIRITGVFKGADTLSELVASDHYDVLPTVDVYLGIEMGILDEQFMLDLQGQLSPDEYIRQLLCINVSARNLIWEQFVRRAMQVGLEADLQIAEPLPDMQYKKRGLLSFGYDHSGHGEDPQSSKYGFVVTEQIGNFCCFIFARSWPPGTDEAIVKEDLKAFWRYFRPDCAMGDAYGIGLLTQLNDELYREGLTHIDRRVIGEGESTASTWPEWAFAPIRFEGMVKHQMAVTLRGVFHNRHAAVPYLDDLDPTDPATMDLRTLIHQLTNIKPATSKASYATYKMARRSVGDDLFDAAMASVWALASRGAAPLDAQIIRGTKSRQQLLQSAMARIGDYLTLPIDPRGTAPCH